MTIWTVLNLKWLHQSEYLRGKFRTRTKTIHPSCYFTVRRTLNERQFSVHKTLSIVCWFDCEKRAMLVWWGDEITQNSSDKADLAHQRVMGSSRFYAFWWRLLAIDSHASSSQLLVPSIGCFISFDAFRSMVYRPLGNTHPVRGNVTFPPLTKVASLLQTVSKSNLLIPKSWVRFALLDGKS